MRVQRQRAVPVEPPRSGNVEGRNRDGGTRCGVEVVCPTLPQSGLERNRPGRELRQLTLAELGVTTDNRFPDHQLISPRLQLRDNGGQSREGRLPYR